MKQQIEIDVPEGMRVTDIIPYRDYIRLELEPVPPKTKRRPPTKRDLLGVDSLFGFVRPSTTESWRRAEIVAVASYGYFTSSATMPYAFAEIEVPADERPLREAWVNYYSDRPDPWGLAYPALRPVGKTAESVHMIEVRP